MAKRSPEPILLIDTTVTIKPKDSTDPADNYEDYFNRSELVYSSGSAATFQGGTPAAQFTFPTPGTWAWEITTPQDFDNETGLSRFLWAHRGEPLEVVIAPKAGGTSWAFDCIAPLGVGVGGTIGAIAQNTLSLSLQGEPVPTFATSPAAMSAAVDEPTA